MGGGSVHQTSGLRRRASPFRWQRVVLAVAQAVAVSRRSAELIGLHDGMLARASSCSGKWVSPDPIWSP